MLIIYFFFKDMETDEWFGQLFGSFHIFDLDSSGSKFILEPKIQISLVEIF